MPRPARQVWRFPLGFADHVAIEMPTGAAILHVALKGDELCLWALVDHGQPVELRYFRIAGTGHPILEDELVHLGSIVFEGPLLERLARGVVKGRTRARDVARSGALVFHVFEDRTLKAKPA